MSIQYIKNHLPIGVKKKLYILKKWPHFIKKNYYLLHSLIQPKTEISKEYELLFAGKQDCLYVICPYGIGDILVGKMLADKTKRNKKKYVFLIRETYSSIANVLKESGECIFDTEFSRNVEKYILSKQRFRGKNYIYGHFPKRKDGSIFFGLGVNKYVWQDYCVYVYGVKKDSLFHIVDTSKFGKNLIKNQKIIICPYAYSTGTLPLEFWEKLTMILMEKNYVIYTNVSQTEKEVVGTNRLECSLSEVIDEANESKLVIAMRSGICDLLAIKSLVPLFVINENEGLAKYWNLEYLRDKGIFNFIVAENLLDNILSKLEEI